MTGLGLQKSRTKAEEQKNILTASIRYLSDIFQGNNFPPPFSEGKGPRGLVSMQHVFPKTPLKTTGGTNFLAQQPFTQHTIASWSHSEVFVRMTIDSNCSVKPPQAMF